MAETSKLLKEAVAELDRLLQARNVMGEPVVQGEVTVVPLVSFGFGFGAGGGSDTRAGGEGGGTGGGGGIKPIAVLILDRDGARVEPVRAAPSVLEAVSAAAAKVAEGVSRGRREGQRRDKPEN